MTNLLHFFDFFSELVHKLFIFLKIKYKVRGNKRVPLKTLENTKKGGSDTR